jgi:pyridoxine/pyridoxamine 5'-phosphate oxidase
MVAMPLRQVDGHKDYDSRGIDPSSLPPSPLPLFSEWFSEAQKTEKEAEAVCLSTSTAGGVPSSRMVLLKAFSESEDDGQEGFYFFTNYESRKGPPFAPCALDGL